MFRADRAPVTSPWGCVDSSRSIKSSGTVWKGLTFSVLLGAFQKQQLFSFHFPFAAPHALHRKKEDGGKDFNSYMVQRSKCVCVGLHMDTEIETRYKGREKTSGRNSMVVTEVVWKHGELSLIAAGGGSKLNPIRSFSLNNVGWEFLHFSI